MKKGRMRAYEEVVHALQRVADILCLVAAHALVCLISGQPWRREMSHATLVGIVAFSVCAEFCGLYRPWRQDRMLSELRTVLASWCLTIGAIVLIAFATKTSADYSRVVSFGWFLAGPFVLCTWRATLRLCLNALRSNGANSRTVAILGATESAERLCAEIAERPWLGLNVKGVYDDRGEHRRHRFDGPGRLWRGTEADLIRACRGNEIDVVYIALPLCAEKRIAHLLRALADTTATVYLVADFMTYDLLHARWGAVGSAPVVSIYDTPFQGVFGALKRLEDILIGSFILLVIAVPLMLIAAAVKLTSRGPIFFRQRRYGLNGREIRVLKFRTMTVCEDGPDIKQATKNDARVTPLGRILRRTSLDELPQFLQVITGEMSIVGPRPHAVSHNETYRGLIRGYMLRHKVKPGITGWAQVNGWRGETPDVSWMEKRVQHDLEYIEKWSLLWDLKIIFLTIAGRKKARNAY